MQIVTNIPVSICTDSESQYVSSNNLRAISTEIVMISITIGIPYENSSDLSSASGRRSVSKSDEFSKGIPMVIEIISVSVSRSLGDYVLTYCLLGFGVRSCQLAGARSG